MDEGARDLIERISVPTDAPLRDVLDAINRGAVGAAFLVDGGGRFVSVVTDGDVRRGLLGGAQLESPAGSVARSASVVATTDMTTEEIAGLFTEQIRVVPVLDEARQVADVAFFDRRARLPVAEPLLGDRELLYVTECILSGWISSAGAFVKRFEEMFAEFCDVEHAVAVGNGTEALHLALLALGIGPGDEVIVPSLTFIATANAVTYTGAHAVPVDSERRTGNIDPAAVANAVTPRTKAILPVHLYGHPADMDAILEIARRHDLSVIEDAAEAHGARYKGTRVGGIGDVGIFSFYGNKIVTTGEGGMVVTNRSDLADSIRLLRSHGMTPERRYWHPVLGYNYRLTNLQAAVGVAQMERVDEIIDAKRAIAQRYSEALRDVPGVEVAREEDWAESVFWLYSVIVDEDEFGMSRDALLLALEGDGIECRPFFPPIHKQPLYDDGRALPVAEQLAATGLSLPSAANLSGDDVARVAEALTQYARPRAPAA